VCEIIIRLRTVNGNMAKFVNGDISYSGPTDLSEFTVVKYKLTDKNITNDKSYKVGINLKFSPQQPLATIMIFYNEPFPRYSSGAILPPGICRQLLIEE
jgi:hypothetical protein